jgi:O-antigen/teichoic acid export membrane protein
MRRLFEHQAALYHNATIVIKTMSGPVTFLLLAERFTELEQGLFFTFLSIGALQLLFEAGMTTSLVQHIASERRFNNGSAIYFGYLRASLIWCVLSAFVFYWVALFFSLYVFSDFSQDLWLSQINAFIFCLSLNILFAFTYVIKEGQGHVPFVYQTKFIGAIISVLFLWVSLFFEAGLYALAAAQLGLLVPLLLRKQTWEIGFSIFNAKHNNLKLAVASLAGFQLRLTAVWITGYLYWNSPILIMFKFVDPSYAGKFGLTFSLMNAINQIGQGWLTTKRVFIGTMIADNQIIEARNYFRKISKVSVSTVAVGLICAVAFSIVLSDYLFFPRALKSKEFLVMAIYFIMLCRLSNLATYTRCYKQEPLFLLFLVMNISVPIIIYIFGLMGEVQAGLTVVVLLHALFLLCAEKLVRRFENKFYLDCVESSSDFKN